MTHPRFRRLPAIALCLVLGLAPAALVVASPSLPLRLNCGGGDTVDKATGAKWISDKPFLVRGQKYRFPGASNIRTDVPNLSKPAPKSVYGSARRDGVVYRFPGLPDGRYLLRLHFADTKPRSNRRMEFWIEGQRLVHDLDVIRRAGGPSKAFALELIVDVTDGNGLDIRGSKGTGDDCFVCGLEILTAPPGSSPAMPAGTHDAAPANLGAAIRDFAGGPVKLVWTRQEDEGDFYSKGSPGQLFVFDTDTGAERCLLPEARSYAKPMIADDGWQIVFTDSVAQACFTVPWSGGHPRKITDGYAADVWLDRQTGQHWVYVRTGWRDTGAPIVRVRLDDPSVREPVWSATATGQAMVSDLQISEDGTQAAGSFPWPQCGVADLRSGDFTEIGGGCWPSIGPGAKPRFFHFLGVHTTIRLFDELGAKPRQVSLATVPGWEGQKLYHPRWSNHPRLITATAPQRAPETELYIGRFDREFTKIEAWQRVTFNHTADFFGDLWFARGATPGGGYATSQPGDAPARPLANPARGASEGDLVFRWDSMNAKNAILGADGKMTRAASATFKGRARPNAWSGADLRDGHLLADDKSAAALGEALGRGETLMVLLSLRAESSDGERVILHAGSARSKAALEIIESDGAPRVTSRGADGRAASVSSSAAVSPGEWERWAVRITQREVSFFKNGVPIGAPSKIERAPVLDPVLVFGARPDGGASWRGQMEGLRIHHRDLEAGEISADAAAAIAAWEGRKSPARTKIEAELVEASEPEALDRLAPYTRSLAENLFKVTRVIEGEKIEGEIVVLQWIIMDGKVLGGTPEAGTRMTLELEAAESHPALAGEHRSTDLFAPELPVFYDVNS